jgi:hypothetical protein
VFFSQITLQKQKSGCNRLTEPFRLEMKKRLSFVALDRLT